MEDTRDPHNLYLEVLQEVCSLFAALCWLGYKFDKYVDHFLQISFVSPQCLFKDRPPRNLFLDVSGSELDKLYMNFLLLGEQRQHFKGGHMRDKKTDPL